MTKTSKTLLFFGNERLVSGLKKTEAPILSGLIERGYTIRAVISHQEHSNSRNKKPLEVAEIAKANNIPVLLPDKPTDIYDELRSFQADAAVLVAYGRIIPQKIIDLFPLGIINLHPSLLPKYRGPTPIETPIVNGDKMSGVSIMQLSAGMDDGPVYAQREFPIESDDDKFDVYDKVTAISTDLFFDVLPSILDGSLRPKPQDDTQATYCNLLKKSDGILDPNSLTALEAERRVRAYLGFPKTKLSIGDQSLIVTKAHVVNVQKTPLDVKFSDGSYLRVDELIAPSGKMMDAAAYLRGYAASSGAD